MDRGFAGSGITDAGGDAIYLAARFCLNRNGRADAVAVAARAAQFKPDPVAGPLRDVAEKER